MLSNDDFDDEMTYLKEVAQSEFSDNQQATFMSISNAQSVQMTASNVEELHENIDVLTLQNSTFQ